jgi:hypothetical protein
MRKIVVVTVQPDDIWLVEECEQNPPVLFARVNSTKKLLEALSKATGVKMELAEYSRDYLYNTFSKTKQ